MSEELDALRAQVSDLQAKVTQLANRPATSQTTVQAVSKTVIPFWDVIVCTGLTLTPNAGVPNDDWSVRFDNANATGWRKHRIPTVNGSLDFYGYLGFAWQKRLQLTWDARATTTVNIAIGGAYQEAGDTDGYIQMKFNGVVTEFRTDADIAGTETLTVKEGRNTLIFSLDERPIRIQLGGILWDESRGDAWVDPSTIYNYVR